MAGKTVLGDVTAGGGGTSRGHSAGGTVSDWENAVMEGCCDRLHGLAGSLWNISYRGKVSLKELIRKCFFSK